MPCRRLLGARGCRLGSLIRPPLRPSAMRAETPGRRAMADWSLKR